MWIHDLTTGGDVQAMRAMKGMKVLLSHFTLCFDLVLARVVACVEAQQGLAVAASCVPHAAGLQLRWQLLARCAASCSMMAEQEQHGKQC